MARKDESVNLILSNIDLLIDGAFDRNLTQNAGEYRGSSNQRLIYSPLLKETMANEDKKSLAGKGWKEELQTKAEFFEFMQIVWREVFVRPSVPKAASWSRTAFARTISKASRWNTV